LTVAQGDLQRRIDDLLESVKGDRRAADELFQYTWTMVCVQRGLMRVVDEMRLEDRPQLVVEEVRSHRQHVVYRPIGIDPDVEKLAVSALARLLGSRGTR
jgi:hypothetical protein